MNDIINLSFEEQPFRVIDVAGETWWVLKDICKFLEMENIQNVIKRLDDDEVGIFYIPTPQNIEHNILKNSKQLLRLP